MFQFYHPNLRDHSELTSRNFCHFLTPSHPIVTVFITKSLALSSPNPWFLLPSPFDRDVIYGRPLSRVQTYRLFVFDTFVHFSGDYDVLQIIV
jgi:hypothetical protein